LQQLCDVATDNLSNDDADDDDDVLCAVLNVILQLSQTVAIARLSYDDCKTCAFVILCVHFDNFAISLYTGN